VLGAVVLTEDAAARPVDAPSPSRSG
jgi:hypothetical protein